jgi:hypothetical protein
MALQGISTGTTPNDGTGDTLLVGAVKINENFEEIYNAIGDGTDLLTGSPNLTVGFVTSTGASFSGDVSIAGTLTYEDVTNIDSIGLVTARSGLDVTGVSTFNDSIGVGTEITLEASSGTVIVGSAVTITSEGIDATGIVTATTFDGSGASLTNIPNGALSFSNVSYGGISVTLGGSDDTPAFDLTDATNYPYSSLTGISTHLLGDGSPQLGADLDLNNFDITGIGDILLDNGNVTLTSGTISASGSITGGSIVKSGGTSAQFLKADGSVDSNTYLTSLGTAILDGDFSSNGLMKRSGAGTYTVVTDNSGNWNTAFGWGDHSTQGYLTSLGDAIQDADFTSNGFMKRTGAGTYTVDTNTYLTSETSHSDVLVDGDFTSNGFMKRTGAGTYTVDTNTYLTSSTVTTEGTWTPVFEGATTAGTYTYATQLGTYLQIGNMITATCNLININTSSAGSGTIQITGLPSASSASKGIHVGSCTVTRFNTAAGVMNLTCEIAAGTAAIVIKQCVDGGSSGDLEVTDKIDNIADIRLTITYFTA